MEYQEIITAYKNNGLDSSSLKEDLEKSKPTSSGEKEGTHTISIYYSDIAYDTTNLLITAENIDKVDRFKLETNCLIKYYLEMFSKLTKDVYIKDFEDIEKFNSEFKNISMKEKFSKVNSLCQKFIELIEYKNSIDIVESIKQGQDVSEDDVIKAKFIKDMFYAFKSESVKRGIYCLDEKFLMALVKYQKNKNFNLDDFMKKQKKTIKLDYNMYLEKLFFTKEDFRDISENLVLTSKNSNIPVQKIIEVYKKVSANELDISFLNYILMDLKTLEEKYSRMEKIYEDEIDNQKRQLKLKETIEELERIKKQIIEKKELEKQEEKERIIGKEEGYTKNLDNEVIKNEETTTVKEQVIPLFFYWFEREDISLSKKLEPKQMKIFFDKIKEIQKQTGARVGIFIITNSNQEVSLKRLKRFQELANDNELPRIIEGLFGGYSSFKIDPNGKITDISIMSKQNRDKISLLLSEQNSNPLLKDMINENETNYLRYQFSDKKDPAINMQYLNWYASKTLSHKDVKKQPLKLIPFIEGNYSGIDVVLDSQLKGLSQLSKFFKSKYIIPVKKPINVNLDSIEDFGDGKEDREDK